ncbi:hypothetical protein ANO11243_075900 [Dothideomycetidae sp. 11243]|nr:hypothetical protein ANO11243_075900 [fungal sp. No.11243]
MGSCYSSMDKGPIDTNYTGKPGESEASIQKTRKKLERSERHRKQNAYAEQMYTTPVSKMKPVSEC